MSNYRVRKMLLPANDERSFGRIPEVKTIVIHNTANDQNAIGEAKFVHSRQSEVTYHYAIDDKEAVQILPLDKSGWHCGDGGTTIGGRNGIAIEICFSQSGGARFDKAEDNAAHLTAQLLKQFGLKVSDVSKHQDWALDNKYCPHRTLNKGWNRFIKMVEKYYNQSSTKTPILASPRASLYQLQKWAEGKKADEEFIKLAPRYIYFSKAYGVDPVVTYAQSAKETGYMHFGGVLDKSFKNTCGLKTKSGGGNYDPNAHQRFSSWDDGIKAQVQHLALYAGQRGSPYKDAIDPRHFDWIKGTAPNVEDLGGRWAPSKAYGTDIVKMMDQIWATKVNADDIKRLQDKYSDDVMSAKVVEKSEEVEDKDIDRQTLVTYVNDGDLANALALVNALPDALMIRTADASEYEEDHLIIQIGGTTVKGADLVLAGEDRAETLQKVSEYISEGNI